MMSQLSNCCNAEIKLNERAGFNFCSTCGRWMNKNNNPVRYPSFEDRPTQPTSTEVEKVIRSVISPNSYIVPDEGIALTQAITRLIQQAEIRGRIDEWETLGDYLTESDKKVVSRTFLDMYRIHGEGLQGKLAQLTSKEANNVTD